MSEFAEGATRRLLLAYAEDSRALVVPLHDAFEAAGSTVTACSDTHPAKTDAIDETMAVIVCWTPAAITSDVANLQTARSQKARKLVSIPLARQVKGNQLLSCCDDDL